MATAENFDDLIDWFGEIRDRPVLLEESLAAELTVAVERMETGLAEHVRGDDDPLGGAGIVRPEPGSRGAALRSDHRRFRTSIDQLHRLLEIVREENHGGHRPAFGQYGTRLVESLRQHRVKESANAGPGTEVRRSLAGQP
jgi:hypothetical protein